MQLSDLRPLLVQARDIQLHQPSHRFQDQALKDFLIPMPFSRRMHPSDGLDRRRRTQLY